MQNAQQDINSAIGLQFYLTTNCNLDCPGCYMISQFPGNRGIIPVSDVKFYINQLSKMPDSDGSVVFSGGEIFNLPVQYLQTCIQSAADAGLSIQLKTNGAWVETARAGEIFNMLGKLRVSRGFCASEDEIQQFVESVPKIRPRFLRRMYARYKFSRTFPMVSTLSLAVSVDDLIHPAQSAQWFAKIAEYITSKPRLAKNVHLVTCSFEKSFDFFKRNVFLNRALNITDVVPGYTIEYKINGQPVESFFCDFVEVNNSTVSDFNPLPITRNDGSLFMPYFFYPDRTVGLENNSLQSVGRVSYIDENGKYKDLNRLRAEIAQKLVSERAR